WRKMMNTTHRENGTMAGPLIFIVPAYGFVMALYLDCLGRGNLGTGSHTYRFSFWQVRCLPSKSGALMEGGSARKSKIQCDSVPDLGFTGFRFVEPVPFAVADDRPGLDAGFGPLPADHEKELRKFWSAGGFPVIELSSYVFEVLRNDEGFI